MAYENDFIMRQVRDMTRMLAKILFGKIQRLMNTSRKTIIRQQTVCMRA